MKKLLLGSTALVAGGIMAAPAMAADPIKIGVGGYYTFYGAAGNIDPTYALNGSTTSYKGFSIIQEGEIHFIGQTKLDNGTSVGLTVELEGWDPNSATGLNQQIDEASIINGCMRDATRGIGPMLVANDDDPGRRVVAAQPADLGGHVIIVVELAEPNLVETELV